jgi:2-isopropylmalate synthase
MSKAEKIIIFDTTLRDGEQSPGASLNADEKLEIAHQLARLGVDVIEAGFPAASQGDFDAVSNIAKKVQGPTICGLARTRKEDILRCYEAVSHAAKPRIHTFIATSDIHLEYKLQKTRKEVLTIARDMVGYARSLCADIEFSPEDAGRSDPEYLYEVLEAVIDAGATTLNIPDTVGYTTPEEFGALIAGIKKNVRNIDKAIISVHCHNDLGLAVANSIAAVQNGARQIECTINGIGERAGNAALEEVAMIFKTRKNLGFITGLDTTQIYRTSRLVSNLTSMLVQPNKAIVGANAFAHESGIHQHGMLKNKTTYEIMDAADIGLTANNIVLGKLSGRHAFRSKLEELGYSLVDEELDKAFEKFKALADKKKNITDWDIESIVATELRANTDYFALDGVSVSCGTSGKPTAEVSIIVDGKKQFHKATGTGPVDAVVQAISQMKLTPFDAKLTEFSVQSVTAGIDAIGEVAIRIEANGIAYIGHAGDTDIVVASTKAYLNALNKAYKAQSRVKKDKKTEAENKTNSHGV